MQLTTAEASATPKIDTAWLPRGILIAVAVLLCFFASLVVFKWPFTRARVTRDLENFIHGPVEMDKFHATFFPPGCVAEDVSLRPDQFVLPGTPVAVKKLIFRTTYGKLLRKRIALLQVQDASATVRLSNFAARSPRPKPSPTKAQIDRFEVDRASIQVERSGKAALDFQVRDFTLLHSGNNSDLPFTLSLRNPEPPGELTVKGSIAWNGATPADSVVSGRYAFSHAELAALRGIGGTLSSSGNFNGPLEKIDIHGSVNVPNFEVKKAGHAIPLAVAFIGVVDAKTGKVNLKPATARLGQSIVDSSVQIGEASDHQGENTAADLEVDGGRIQDFLYLLLQAPEPPMTGTFSFQGKADLPPGSEPFQQKVQLQGDFGIGGGKFTNPKTQQNIENLSEKGEGEPKEMPESVVSDLRGHVELKEGTFTFSSLSFRAPGGLAKLHGTYNLVNHQVDLRGTIFAEVTLSHATTGAKSFFLKIIGPFLKKNRHHGAVIPVRITGTYPHPTYKIDPI